MISDQPFDAQSDRIFCPMPRRLLVMLYDGIILMGLLIMASALALPFGDADKLAFRDFWFTLWLLSVCFSYLAICWRHVGMTVGMRAWRVRLISENQTEITWSACVVRFVVGLFSLSFFGLGILWALVDQKNRGWHDLAAGTILIQSKMQKQKA